jgi:hypothetical protein
MLVYEVIVVLIPVVKWIACCDASVIILCRCTISTFASVVLTPIFCFVNVCHGPTIFLIPVGSGLSVALLVQLHPASVPLLHSHQQQFSASGPIDW